MFTEIIKDKWENKNKNDKAAIELWNSKADYFGSYELENVQNERFIQIIKENNLINKDSFILDVGCGAGKYCAALADDCFKCIGTDLSPRMIDFAKEKSKQYDKKKTYAQRNGRVPDEQLEIVQNKFHKQNSLIFLQGVFPTRKVLYNFNQFVVVD